MVNLNQETSNMSPGDNKLVSPIVVEVEGSTAPHPTLKGEFFIFVHSRWISFLKIFLSATRNTLFG